MLITCTNASVLNLKEKTLHHCFFYFQIACNYQKSFMPNLLNIIFDDFGIKFSCLYIPQGHYFISTLWLWNIDEYLIFWFWAKVFLILR